MKITGEQLKKIVPKLTINRANSLAEISNQLCIKYGILDADVYAEFIANLAHESGGFSLMKESLYYTKPERLVDVWPTRFTMTGNPMKKNAKDWVKKPKELANLVYGGRMGNIHAGDGAKFIGGGYSQITGRDAYTLLTRFVNNRDNTTLTIEQVSELVQTTDLWAFDSAFWFFCEYKNLESLAIKDEFQALVKRWNGGLIGLSDREKYYNAAKEVLG